jgi:transketolase
MELSKLDPQALENLCINTIRILSADAVQQANSGHPGMPMGSAAMAYTLWMKFLKFNPANPNWADRDRFVLSAGHGSMLLYSLLHLTGYALPLSELKRFRQWHSMTPGHPERGHTPGVEVATGPLGQGFSNAVGMAIAEQWLAARFNKPDHKIVDHFTYGICGDGDMMEGITHEAASLAGHLQLGKLIFMYDQNRVTLAGGTDLTFTEDVGKRFQAYGWQAIHVEDGNDTAEVAAALEQARLDTERPSLLVVRTHIGFGSPHKHDNFSSHGSPLGEDELLATKEALGWPSKEKFFLPEEAVAHFREALPRGAEAQKEWEGRLAAYTTAYPAEATEFDAFTRGKIPDDFAADVPKWKPTDKAIATRVAGGEVMNALAKRIQNLMGGSADLNPSTNTALKGAGDFQPVVAGGASNMGAVGGPWGYIGRNVAFGVREHGMGAAVNGMAAHGGILPFGATFLVFSDYMKASVRLSALSQLKSLWVYTHDSIGVGEDGPTHEPVEQLAGLRAIPGLTVIRPADPTETAEAWVFAVQHSGPTLFALCRQNVPHLDRGSAKDANAAKGAYILAEADAARPDVILIGTGSEVQLCMAAKDKLKTYGVNARVVSMPSMNLFEQQDDQYRETVLPKAIRARVTVEAGSTFGWDRWAGPEGIMIGINHYGASAPGDEVLKRNGFRAENVTAAGLRVLGRNAEADKEAASDLEFAEVAPMHHA